MNTMIAGTESQPGSQVDLLDLDPAGLSALMAQWNQPAYRARRIWEWLYQKRVSSMDEMSNLPKTLRAKLAAETRLTTCQPHTVQHSSDGQTKKYLFQLADGLFVETVLMRYDKRRTLCISTQAGCAMGCVFCATGQMGFFRNLSTGEIVSQVLFLARELDQAAERITNIVMMGMGEPLHNYKATLQALDTLTDEHGLNLGARKITVSTVGLVPAIRRYADEQRQTPLAVSLHAATDAERSKLIPINQRWPIADLLDACRYYIDKTGPRLTFEWALISDENDVPEQAHALGKLVRGMLCHVNLIPLNLTGGYGGQPSTRGAVAEFQHVLAGYGVSSTVRVRRGIDIQAGCGQLRDRVVAEIQQAAAAVRPEDIES